MTKRTKLLAALLILALLPLGTAFSQAVPVAYRGDSDSPKIAVTIDDCYSIDMMRGMLALAEEYDVRFTFFAVGEAIYNHPGVWQDVIDGGHEIGNHTYNHVNLRKLSQAEIAKQLRKTQKQLNKALGYEYPMRLMRPPFGEGAYPKKVSKNLLAAMEDQGYVRAVMWTSDKVDSKHIMKTTKNGSILLFHTREKDLKVMRRVIPQLLDAGFELVTVSDLIGLEPMALKIDEAPGESEEPGAPDGPDLPTYEVYGPPWPAPPVIAEGGELDLVQGEDAEVPEA